MVADHKADSDTDDISFNDGEWHFMTVTFDRDGDMKMYQDGEQVASDSMADVGSTLSGNPIRLAQDGTSNYGQFFKGKIGQTVIYDYVLSDSEITAIFNQ